MNRANIQRRILHNTYYVLSSEIDSFPSSTIHAEVSRKPIHLLLHSSIDFTIFFLASMRSRLVVISGGSSVISRSGATSSLLASFDGVDFASGELCFQS
jgi:hypothetical protein